MDRTPEVPGAEVKKQCKEHAVLDASNFKSTIKSRRQQFVISGSGQSYTIRLTRPGLDEARELARQLNDNDA